MYYSNILRSFRTQTFLFALLAVMVTGMSLYTPSGSLLAQGKPASPAATATATFDGITATVNYAQPSKKGREVFGKLVPFGEVWRTGANAATTLTLSGDAMIAGKALKAGTYGLFTIPTKDKWTIIVNSVAKQFGAFSYSKDKDVLRVDVPSAASKDAVEMFTIAFEKADKGTTMTLAWDMTKVFVPMMK
jgi:hypothetical protein